MDMNFGPTQGGGASASRRRPCRSLDAALTAWEEHPAGTATHVAVSSGTHRCVDRAWTLLQRSVLAVAMTRAVVRAQREWMHNEVLSDEAPTDLVWPDAFQLPAERRPIPLEVAEDPMTPTLLREMQKEAKLEGGMYDGRPLARWEQHMSLLREASRVVRDRRALGGGGSPTAEECSEMRFMALARAL